GPVEELNPYFLGSIVLIKGDSPNSQVIDGQQRLTTLTLLLASLRVLVPDDFAHDINSHLSQPARPLMGIPARFRLELRPQDKDFFRRHVQQLPGENGGEGVGISALSDIDPAVLKI